MSRKIKRTGVASKCSVIVVCTNIKTTTISNLNGGINNCANAGEGDVDHIAFNTCKCKEDIAMFRSLLGIMVDERALRNCT